ASGATPEVASAATEPAPQPAPIEQRVAKLENQALRIGPVRVSGDFRLRFDGQLSTGPFNNPLTLDQDFTAVTARAPISINEAWVEYRPKKAVTLQGGRVQEVFADNSRFLFDDDIRFNGFNEK